MFSEDDIKRLKRQEWESFGPVGKDDAQAIKAAKAAERALLKSERAAAKAERDALKAQQRGWQAIERAERHDAGERWKKQQADHWTTAKKAKATAEWTAPAPAKKKRWQDDSDGAPAKGCKNPPAPGWDDYPADAKRKWTDDASYYGEPAPAGCWLALFSVPGFATIGLLVLVALFLLAQVAANR